MARKRIKIREKKLRTISMAQYSRLISSRFKGAKLVGAIKAAYQTKMGEDIEIYDVGSDEVVGAIHPDGATMIINTDNWKRSVHKCEPVGAVPYNELWGRKPTKKRRMLIEEPEPKKKRVRKKIRKTLNS